MVKILPQSRDRYVWVHVEGRFTEDDYQTLTPFLERRIESHRSLRVLFELTDLHGWQAKSAFEEMSFVLKHQKNFEKIAFVGSRRTEEILAWLIEIFSSSIVEFFSADNAKGAWDWLHADDTAEYLSFASQGTV